MLVFSSRVAYRAIGLFRPSLTSLHTATMSTATPTATASNDQVTVTKQWVLGPKGLPIWTVQYAPKDVPAKAHIVFVHGFAEHIARYEHYFTLLSSPPSSLSITAFDQRGHGETAFNPLSASSEHITGWKAEGHKVKSGGNGKRRSSWAENLADIEFFVQRELEAAQAKPVFLYGFSMGGGLALAFATRGKGVQGVPVVPAQETVNKLAGLIAGGPLILQTRPAPWWQVAAGTHAAKLFPHRLIPTPLNHSHLSHNVESNERNKADIQCEQTGSLKLVSDMLGGGKSLIEEGYKYYPKNLPLLIVHGEEDLGSKAFIDKVEATDKQLKLFPGIYHEIHNELEPTPTDCANFVTAWIHNHLETPSTTLAQSGSEVLPPAALNSKL